MANIFTLTLDVFLYILSFLDTQDRIAFAFTCERFRRLCVYRSWVFRKVDLSARAVVKTQRGVIRKFFGDKEMVRHIRELNISNCRVFNWQIDDQLEEFIVSICPHLEALHVLNCGMSLQRLHRILKQAPKLTELSWSLWDFTSEDIEFLANSIESTDEICLKDIKHLHLETFPSKPHIQIVEYLVLCCCKYLEELQIYTWPMDEAYCTALDLPLIVDQMIPGFPQPSTSVAHVLQNLHSLTVGDPSYSCSFPHSDHVYMAELCNFISSVLRKKSSLTKWEKLWISPPIGIDKLQYLFHLTDSSLNLRELHSVEAITAHAGESENAVDKLKTLFQSIDDNTVRSLHLCETVSWTNSILELCEPILRVAGQALKFLSLSSFGRDAETNVFIHTLFSNCSNIVELDLLGCYFEKDICEPLSKLKNLTKVQLMPCAISSKHCSDVQAIHLLTFVQNCTNITEFDIRGCRKHFSCRLTDGDLLALAKLKNLKSLTLYEISGIREWKFLQNISENCKFLTMLRISDTCFNFKKSHLLILMESAKFLKHLAMRVNWLDLQSERFWNLLSRASNLERLCICSFDHGLINIRVAVETLKSLPRLQVLHLHTYSKENVEIFHNQIKRMLEGEKCYGSSSFELVTEYHFKHMSLKRQIFKKALPLNVVELCDKTPILSIPRF